MKKRKLSSFIDGKKYFLKSGIHKAGRDVVYKRMSDEKISLGNIRWFEESNGKVIVTLTDNLLGSFQTCFVEDIQESPDKKTVKKLKEKWAKSL